MLFIAALWLPAAGWAQWKISADSTKPWTEENLAKIHAGNLEELKGRAGKGGKSLEEVLRLAYPDFRLVEACEGSFKREGTRDFALGMIDPKSKMSLYAVFTREAAGSYAGKELLRFASSEGKGIALTCASWTEMRRIRADYAGRMRVPELRIPAYVDSGLRSRFDVACIAPPGDMEFLCYGFDSAKKRFERVAAWSNER